MLADFSLPTWKNLEVEAVGVIISNASLLMNLSNRRRGNNLKFAISS